MATNYYECSRCGRYTRHIKLGLREYQALVGGNALEQFGGAFDDITGITSALSFVMGRSCWKCCECGSPSVRKLNGEEV